MSGEMAGRGENNSRLWTGEAPAKVNLLLRILEREPSGYHRIETVFQALELADRVEIERRDSGSPPITLEVDGVEEGELGPPESNLAYRAASRFREELLRRGGTFPPLRIRLEKRIPHGAGLGGGSSDAAAVLRGVNALAGSPLSSEELLRMSAELGSDVPFFLLGAARAMGTGRGEVLHPLSALPQREVLLLVPSEGIATGWAYGVLAETRAASSLGSFLTPSEQGLSQEAENGGGMNRDLLAGRPSAPTPMAVGSDWPGVMALAWNDFEPVLFPRRPELSKMKALLLAHGGELALLSGSGSVVFGVFSDAEGLEAAAAEARQRGVRSLRTRTATWDASL